MHRRTTRALVLFKMVTRAIRAQGATAGMARLWHGWGPNAGPETRTEPATSVTGHNVMPLEYHRRRDFTRTTEPKGNDVTESSGAPRFVIQEHDASSHHFDFRLEVDGVLKSWAVPRGPSTDPSEKRLALPTEDHPLDYADYEGVIPEGEYGAGTVLLWDTGPYRNLKEDDDGEPVPLSDQLSDGHATVWLEGEKLRGGYALVRVAEDEDERWLLVKMADDEADARRRPVSTEPESVKSGRTLDEVAGEEAGGEAGENDGGESGEHGR